MIRKLFAVACSAVLLGALLPSTAMALTPLAPGVFDYSVEYGGAVTSTTHTDTQTYPVGGLHTLDLTAPSGTEAISQSTDTTPVSLLISATATAIPFASDSQAATAETTITFQLEPLGPGATTPVLVQALLQSHGQVDPGGTFGVFGQATGYTELNIFDGLSEHHPDYYDWSGCPFQGCTNTIHFNLNQVINLKTNTVYTVRETVLAIAAVQKNASQTLTSTASADPHFFSSGSGSLLISPGLGILLGTVPEPESWALMILGLGLAGAALRRRQARALI